MRNAVIYSVNELGLSAEDAYVVAHTCFEGSDFWEIVPGIELLKLCGDDTFPPDIQTLLNQRDPQVLVEMDNEGYFGRR